MMKVQTVTIVKPYSDTVRLGELAHTRSGDKGNRSNIGVIAFTDEIFAHLQKYLTAEIVQDFFRPLGISDVRRYELPKLRAFNFVIDQALSGGASQSLRWDTQGKAFGEAIKEIRLETLDHEP